MPITRSAKKAMRQTKRRYEHNNTIKSAVKKEIKQLKKLAAQKNIDAARAQLSRVYQALDKTAKAHVFKKNKASRLKSRLTKFVQKISITK